MEKRSFKTVVILLALTISCLIPTNVAEAAIVSVPAKSTFDANFYASTYPEVAATYGKDFNSLLDHYITIGKWEGKLPNAEAAAYTNTKIGDYNILFIGNSITLHPVCSYWWGSWGMAATSADKDYVHQVVAGMQQYYPLVDYDVVPYASWEETGVRNKVLPNLDVVLNNDYDLIVIQLGENITSKKTFEKDYETFVSYIQKSVPQAQIVLVGDFCFLDNRDTIKESVAEKLGVAYADLSDFRLKKSSQSAYGTKVLGDDGKWHTVTDSAVVLHPNDTGMQLIAEKILECVTTDTSADVEALKTYAGNTDEFNAYVYYINNVDLQIAIGSDGDKLLEHYNLYGKSEGRLAK